MNVAETSERFLRKYVGAELGDGRLTRRLERIAGPLMVDPSRRFPRAFDAAQPEATYRFCNNPYVRPSAVLEPHRREAIRRASGATAILAVHDTTAFKFDPEGARKGLGRLRAAG
jgi:hypothetical protein